KTAIKAGMTLIPARRLFVCSGISLRRIQLEKRFSTLYVIPSAVKRARAVISAPVGARDLAFVGATKQHYRHTATLQARQSYPIAYTRATCSIPRPRHPG